MNWILKNKNKSSRTLLIVLFLAFAFLNSSVFWKAEIVLAVEPNCVNDAICLDTTRPGYDSSLSKCNLMTGACTTPAIASAANNTPATAKTSSAPPLAEKSGSFIADTFVKSIRTLLTGVQSLVLMLFGMAATLFAWVIAPENISGPNGLLNKPAVKDVWIMVRDLLNMTFILILLFAAFCTIFQVEKWNLKKVWLNILINALLVNFSYPIARFFIDVSNVAFYYFVSHLFSPTGTTVVNGSSIMAGFGAASNIGSMLQPNDFTSNPIAYQIAMIIVIFIMGMTLLIVAALFVVRLIALTMLVMFSPIGFVGYIFPSTAKHADSWWSQLFSYSFFAPVMIFVMAVALHVAETLKNENFQSFVTNANVNTPAPQANFIAQAAFFVIPIIILWMGIGVAKSAGIAGADTVVGAAKKGGKWLASNPALGLGGYAWKRSGVPGGIKKGYENATKSGKLFGSEKLGLILKNGQEGRENKVSGFMDNRMKGVNDAVEKKKAEEFRKKYKEKADEHDRVDAVGRGGVTDRILKADLHNDDANVRGKAAMEVASLLHALKSDSGKKDAFELKIRESVMGSTAVAGMSDAETELHIKKEIAKNWKTLNEKGKQAHEVAIKGKKPTDSSGAPAVKIDHASATAAGNANTWT